MNVKASETNPAAPSAAQPLKRRGLLIGAGVAGAAALAVKGLPGPAPVSSAAALVKPVIDNSAGGYQLTPHVLRYYETARA